MSEKSIYKELNIKPPTYKPKRNKRSSTKFQTSFHQWQETPRHG